MGDKIAFAIVVTSRPGGLGKEFAHLVAGAITRVFKTDFEVAAVVYTSLIYLKRWIY